MNSTKLSLRYAMVIFTGLVLYFFLMKFFGLEHVTELRLFNFAIVLVGLYRLIQHNMLNGNTRYIPNLFLAFRTSAIAIVFTGAGLFFYLKVIDPSFMAILESSLAWGNGLAIPQAVIAITIEGVASSMLMAYMVMQYMKSYAEDHSLSQS